MLPSATALDGRGQLQASDPQSTVPRHAPRGILTRGDNASSVSRTRTPSPRVRFNARTYVIDAPEGGDWRKRAQRRVALAVVYQLKKKDWGVMYPTLADVAEYMGLRGNTMDNARPRGQPVDLRVDALPVAQACCGLDVVDLGDEYSPAGLVGRSLPEGIQVTEEWLRGTGDGTAGESSIDEYDTYDDLPGHVYDDLIDSIAEMMAPGITSFEDLEDIENIEDMEAIEDIEAVEDIEDIKDIEDIEAIETIEAAEDIEDLKDANVNEASTISFPIVSTEDLPLFEEDKARDPMVHDKWGRNVNETSTVPFPTVSTEDLAIFEEDQASDLVVVDEWGRFVDLIEKDEEEEVTRSPPRKRLTSPPPPRPLNRSARFKVRFQLMAYLKAVKVIGSKVSRYGQDSGRQVPVKGAKKIKKMQHVYA